jgi:hypothetical protein
MAECVEHSGKTTPHPRRQEIHVFGQIDTIL